MKKFIILGVFAAITITAISIIPMLAERSIPTVATQTPLKIPYHETIHGTGTIAYKSQNSISLEVPVIINKITVKEGDFVNIGQIVGYIDKEKTLTMLAGLSKNNLSEMGAESLAAATEMIPKEITSDFMGKVIFKVNDGEIVQSSHPILSLSNTDEMVANISIKENDITKIKIGQRADLSGTAFEKNSFYGTVESIATSARKNYVGTVAETVVDIKILIKNPTKDLRSGYNTSASIATEIPRDIYVLPYDMINQDDEGEFVYVVENGAAIRRNIETGVELNEGAQILKGVAPDEKVVKNPSEISKNTVIKQANSIT